MNLISMKNHFQIGLRMMTQIITSKFNHFLVNNMY